MEATVAAAVIPAVLALLGTLTGLYLQARGQAIARRLQVAAVVSDERQIASDAVLEAWKRIVTSLEERVKVIEQSERDCQNERIKLIQLLAERT